MKGARKLVYEDKRSLSNFNINESGSLNHLVYYEWLKKRTEIDPFDAKSIDYYLKAFNDAYYICTLALLLPEGKELKPFATKNYVERPSIVFPMVHLYLSKLKGGTFGIRVFLDSIETKCKQEPDWEHNLIQLQEAVSDYEGSIEPTIFAQRVLTKEFLSSIKWEEFSKLTNTFDKQTIKILVINYARNHDSWTMMCEAIKEAAISYDYDYGFEDYEQEGVDEDGPYVQTIKVPKEPYDCDGNEILEPLKRAGVYEFCDELKDRYDELALVSQVMVQESLGQEDSDGKDSCFRFSNDFVKERVKMALRVCKKYKSDLALLEVVLYDHNLLKESNKHLEFLRGLVGWGLLPEISSAEDSDQQFEKTLYCIHDKAKKLPNDKYMTWDNNDKGKAKCIEMGKLLGESMKYKF